MGTTTAIDATATRRALDATGRPVEELTCYVHPGHSDDSPAQPNGAGSYADRLLMAQGRKLGDLIASLPDWMADAACGRQANGGHLGPDRQPEAARWAPEDRSTASAFASAFCQHCPVAQECLDHGTREGLTGVFAGQWLEGWSDSERSKPTKRVAA